MQCVIACILLLAVCSPVIVASEKVVFVVPRQIRRSPALSPRPQLIHQPSYQSKRSYYPTGTKRPFESASIVYGKSKPYGYDKRQLPHGGDDFDQGLEGVRHITIPHSKGITHGISFGRGYIPYSNLKSDYTRIVPSPESKPDFSYHHPSGPTATEPVYAEPTSSQFSPSFPPPEYNYPERKITNDQLNLNQEAYLNFQTVDNSANPSSVVNYAASKSSDNFQDSSQVQKYTTTDNHNILSLNNNRKGVVISDSVLLEDYNKKVEEFTNSWPKVVGPNSNLQASQLTSGMLLGGFTVPLAQGRQGYAVHEDTQESPSNFHGTVNPPFQLSRASKNFDVSSLISVYG